jgi:hypothetical protein
MVQRVNDDRDYEDLDYEDERAERAEHEERWKRDQRHADQACWEPDERDGDGPVSHRTR